MTEARVNQVTEAIEEATGSRPGYGFCDDCEAYYEVGHDCWCGYDHNSDFINPPEDGYGETWRPTLPKRNID